MVSLMCFRKANILHILKHELAYNVKRTNGKRYLL